MNYFPRNMSYTVNWATKIDPVFRVFDNIQWMDNFFERGEIMLSCLENFKRNPNEMQGDKMEGHGILGGQTNNGKTREYIIYDSGVNAYIMCTTTELDKKVINDFNGKCAIKINNPTLFGLEVSKKLPFVKSGVEGKCEYENNRSLLFNSKNKENKIFQDLDFANNPNELNQNIIKGLTQGRELFIKDKKYKHQNEYRFIWFSDSNIDKSIIINCPEAIKYCERVEF